VTQSYPLNPGDEVILFEPYYGYHINTILAAEAVPTYIGLKAPDWTFSPEDLERVVTPRTKGIMINTPANPSGKVFSRIELEWISEFADRHDLFVFTNEIYTFYIRIRQCLSLKRQEWPVCRMRHFFTNQEVLNLYDSVLQRKIMS